MGKRILMGLLVAVAVIGGATIQHIQESAQVQALSAHIASMHMAGCMDSSSTASPGATPMPPMDMHH